MRYLERFTKGGFSYIPENVKHCESPGKAGGLPLRLINIEVIHFLFLSHFSLFRLSRKILIELLDGFYAVTQINAVVPSEHGHGLVSGDRHDQARVDSCLSHVGDGRMLQQASCLDPFAYSGLSRVSAREWLS